MNRASCVVLGIVAASGCSNDPAANGGDAGGDAAADAGTDVAPPADAATDVNGGGNDAAADSPVDVGVDSAQACAGGAAPVTETAADGGEALLASANPTLHFTPMTILAVQDQLVGLFRFPLSAIAATALKSQRARSLTATFTRAVSDPACGSASNHTCQTAAGVFTAYPLKVTWDPGSVTWAIRSTGVAWGAAGAQGATDIGAEAWHANIDTMQPTMVVTLDPATFDLSTVQADNSIAVRISSTTGAFVVATGINATYAHPTLAITYCP